MRATQTKELPTFAEVAPRWADLTRKLLYLNRQYEDLLTESEGSPSISDRLPHAPAPPQQSPKQKTLSAAAKAALGDLEIPEPPSAEWRAPDPATESTLAFGDPAVKHAADRAVRMNGVIEAIAAIQAELPPGTRRGQSGLLRPDQG